MPGTLPKLSPTLTPSLMGIGLQPGWGDTSLANASSRHEGSSVTRTLFHLSLFQKPLAELYVLDWAQEGITGLWLCLCSWLFQSKERPEQMRWRQGSHLARESCRWSLWSWPQPVMFRNRRLLEAGAMGRRYPRWRWMSAMPSHQPAVSQN